MDVEKPLSFWKWFLTGRNGNAGWRTFVDRWLLLHVVVGGILGWFLPMPLDDAARAVLLPLAGIFVGMSFAWVGNAQAILQNRDIEKFTEKSPGGIETYVYTFQSAILVILITLILWGMAGLGFFEATCPWSCPSWTYNATAGLLFFLASLTLRECWHVVMGAQLLLFAHRLVQKLALEDKKKEGTP